MQNQCVYCEKNRSRIAETDWRDFFISYPCTDQDEWRTYRQAKRFTINR